MVVSPPDFSIPVRSKGLAARLGVSPTDGTSGASQGSGPPGRGGGASVSALKARLEGQFNPAMLAPPGAPGMTRKPPVVARPTEGGDGHPDQHGSPREPTSADSGEKGGPPVRDDPRPALPKAGRVRLRKGVMTMRATHKWEALALLNGEGSVHEYRLAREVQAQTAEERKRRLEQLGQEVNTPRVNREDKEVEYRVLLDAVAKHAQDDARKAHQARERLLKQQAMDRARVRAADTRDAEMRQSARLLQEEQATIESQGGGDEALRQAAARAKTREESAEAKYRDTMDRCLEEYDGARLKREYKFMRQLEEDEAARVEREDAARKERAIRVGGSFYRSREIVAKGGAVPVPVSCPPSAANPGQTDDDVPSALDSVVDSLPEENQEQGEALIASVQVRLYGEQKAARFKQKRQQQLQERSPHLTRYRVLNLNMLEAMKIFRNEKRDECRQVREREADEWSRRVKGMRIQHEKMEHLQLTEFDREKLNMNETLEARVEEIMNTIPDTAHDDAHLMAVDGVRRREAEINEAMKRLESANRSELDALEEDRMAKLKGLDESMEARLEKSLAEWKDEYPHRLPADDCRIMLLFRHWEAEVAHYRELDAAIHDGFRKAGEEKASEIESQIQEERRCIAKAKAEFTTKNEEFHEAAVSTAFQEIKEGEGAILQSWRNNHNVNEASLENVLRERNRSLLDLVRRDIQLQVIERETCAEFEFDMRMWLFTHDRLDEKERFAVDYFNDRAEVEIERLRLSLGRINKALATADFRLKRERATEAYAAEAEMMQVRLDSIRDSTREENRAKFGVDIAASLYEKSFAKEEMDRKRSKDAFEKKWSEEERIFVDDYAYRRAKENAAEHEEDMRYYRRLKGILDRESRERMAMRREDVFARRCAFWENMHTQQRMRKEALQKSVNKAKSGLAMALKEAELEIPEDNACDVVIDLAESPAPVFTEAQTPFSSRVASVARLALNRRGQRKASVVVVEAEVEMQHASDIVEVAEEDRAAVFQSRFHSRVVRYLDQNTYGNCAVYMGLYQDLVQCDGSTPPDTFVRALKKHGLMQCIQKRDEARLASILSTMDQDLQWANLNSAHQNATWQLLDDLVEICHASGVYTPPRPGSKFVLSAASEDDVLEVDDAIEAQDLAAGGPGEMKLASKGSKDSRKGRAEAAGKRAKYDMLDSLIHGNDIGGLTDTPGRLMGTPEEGVHRLFQEFNEVALKSLASVRPAGWPLAAAIIGSKAVDDVTTPANTFWTIMEHEEDALVRRSDARMMEICEQQGKGMVWKSVHSISKPRAWDALFRLHRIAKTLSLKINADAQSKSPRRELRAASLALSPDSKEWLFKDEDELLGADGATADGSREDLGCLPGESGYGRRRTRANSAADGLSQRREPDESESNLVDEDRTASRLDLSARHFAGDCADAEGRDGAGSLQSMQHDDTGGGECPAGSQVVATLGNQTIAQGAENIGQRAIHPIHGSEGVVVKVKRRHGRGQSVEVGMWDVESCEVLAGAPNENVDFGCNGDALDDSLMLAITMETTQSWNSSDSAGSTDCSRLVTVAGLIQHYVITTTDTLHSLDVTEDSDAWIRANPVNFAETPHSTEGNLSMSAADESLFGVDVEGLRKVLENRQAESNRLNREIAADMCNLGELEAEADDLWDALNALRREWAIEVYTNCIASRADEYNSIAYRLMQATEYYKGMIDDVVTRAMTRLTECEPPEGSMAPKTVEEYQGLMGVVEAERLLAMKHSVEGYAALVKRAGMRAVEAESVRLEREDRIRENRIGTLHLASEALLQQYHDDIRGGAMDPFDELLCLDNVNRRIKDECDLIRAADASLGYSVHLLSCQRAALNEGVLSYVVHDDEFDRMDTIREKSELVKEEIGQMEIKIAELKSRIEDRSNAIDDMEDDRDEAEMKLEASLEMIEALRSVSSGISDQLLRTEEAVKGLSTNEREGSSILRVIESYVKSGEL